MEAGDIRLLHKTSSCCDSCQLSAWVDLILYQNVMSCHSHDQTVQGMGLVLLDAFGLVIQQLLNPTLYNDVPFQKLCNTGANIQREWQQYEEMCAASSKR